MKHIVCVIMILILVAVPCLAEETARTLSELAAGHGSLVSMTDEPVTEAELMGVLEFAATVTLGNKDAWHMTAVTDLDLIQELLPTYDAAGLVRPGCVAVIVSCTSESGDGSQYNVPDMARFVAAGMVAQQICVGAQMQGLGFMVITDAIRESGYTLYRDNEPSDENLLHEATDWTEWRRGFAIPKEAYYVPDPSGEPIRLMNGNAVPLKSGSFVCYEADGSVAEKKRVSYVEDYMTPCAIVLIGHTGDAPKPAGVPVESRFDIWDGSYEPYPESYGGSGQSLK